MATELDATTSIYKIFNDFIGVLATDPQLPEFEFVSTTSLESAYQVLNTTSSKIVVVQTHLKEVNKKFTEIEYALVPSFSGADATADYNSLLMHKVNSKFTETYPQYTTVPVYEAEGLMAAASEFNLTSARLVVTKLEQDILGAEQLQNNFNSLRITFLGYLG